MTVAGTVPLPRDAATVIVTRDAADGLEAYMVRRSAKSKAFPDAYVFPGGTVDPEDYSPEARSRLVGRCRPDEPAFTYAAIRETFEECGLLFADVSVDLERLRAVRRELLAGRTSFAEVVRSLDARLDATAVHYFARRITKPSAPYRFDARFFVAELPAGQVAEADAFETHDGDWVRPKAMIEAAARNEFHVLPPTLKHLERIARFADVASLIAFADSRTDIP